MGIINGVRYDNVEDFKQAMEKLKEETKTQCIEEEVIQHVDRPSIYATDVDYIIPNFSEFKIENLVESAKDVTAKLERRMSYFAQEMSLNHISKTQIEELCEKTKTNIVSVQQHIDKINDFIDFAVIRPINISILIEEREAIGNILGFYISMLDNFEDNLKKMNSNPPILQSKNDEEQNTADPINVIINKLRELDAEQLDKIGRVLSNL